MLLHPIKASEWTRINPANQKLLKDFGALPYNDVYQDIWQIIRDIWLLFGGRGGGKSEIVCDKLLNDCLNDPYFKCYYGRKVFDTVRGSCFETLDYCIQKNNLQRHFSYSTANTSSMIITCENGNKFIPFGSDKADKLKSIKDPTHVWCEEFDQFTFDDFKDIYPTLRTERGSNEFYGSFNTHGVYLNLHWIIKLFFPELYTGDDKQEFDILHGVSVGKIFANYTDNHWIDKEKYRNSLRLASGGNSTLFEAIANGAWGVVENKMPWLSAFDDSKHVKDKLPILPDYPVHLAFDFNNSPFACTAWQHNESKGDERVSFIHCVKEFTGDMKVEEMCNRILSYFPSMLLYVNGDRSGQNEDIGRNHTLFQMIAAHLGINYKKQVILHPTNLEHADSRIFMNQMFNNYPNIFISREGCPNLIRQCNAATVDVRNSAKPQALLKNREDHKNDEFDSMRYYFQDYFHEFAQKKYLRMIK